MKVSKSPLTQTTHVHPAFEAHTNFMQSLAQFKKQPATNSPKPSAIKTFLSKLL